MSTPTTPATRRKSSSGSSKASTRGRKSSIGGSSSKFGTPSPIVDERKWCQAVFKELTKKSSMVYAWPFMAPVDPISLGIPDYFDVIKEPMDLSTVKSKLDSNSYDSVNEFESDIKLMFKNCYTYNGPDTDIVGLAKNLEAIFNSKCAQKPANLQPSTMKKASTSKTSIEDDSLSEQIQKLIQERDLINQKIENLVAKQHAREQAAIRKRKAEEDAKPLTFAEKENLSISINNLSPDKLPRVLEIIHTNMPSLKEVCCFNNTIIVF